MKKYHGIKPGEITLREAQALACIKQYPARKAFENLEHRGLARLGTRAIAPFGKCCYVDRQAWLAKFLLIAKQSIQEETPVGSDALKNLETEKEVPLIESGIREDELKKEPETLEDSEMNISWEKDFKEQEEEISRREEQPAAPAALEPEDQYKYDEIYDIVSDFEVVKHKKGTARAGCKAAVRIMKRRGISNAFVDWSIFCASAGTLLFAAIMRYVRGDRTETGGEEHPDKTDTSNRSQHTPSRDIRSNGEIESRTLGNNIPSTENVNVTHSWFNTD